MRFKPFMFSLLMLAMSIVPIGSCNREPSVDVKFEIYTGLGIQHYYFCGDHFWYEITITNSGTTTMNATFTVTVRNTTGGVFGEVASYKRYLEPKDTTILYPNYTRFGSEEYFIYFMDTVGTYTIELTCDVPLYFFRYYVTGRYTVEHIRCHMSIDVMPSYQRQYIEQSRQETNKIQALAFASLMIAAVAVAINIISLPKTRRERFRTFLFYMCLVMIAILVFVILHFLV